MHEPVITQVEYGVLEGERPRAAGCNARLGAHGSRVRVPLARLSTDSGCQGIGWCRATREQAIELIGRPFHHVLSRESGAGSRWRAFEYPLWDLAGQLCGEPVYQMVAADREVRTRVPCYDTSLYFDDLDLPTAEAAAQCMAAEAQQGHERGHRAFKVKVGRGAFHMPVEEGMVRDIAIVRAVREAIGPTCPIMLDANNGLNLNLAKRLLSETADCGIFWLEEPFHEDAVLYRELRAWMGREGIEVLVADGEGDASRHLLDLARDGLIDVVQYDVYYPGFSQWLEIGRQLDGWGRKSAPHHYGGAYGNYAACHLASAIDGFCYAEWDEAIVPGLDASRYSIIEGRIHLPEAPGFGLMLDADRFDFAVKNGGWTAAQSRSG